MVRLRVPLRSVRFWILAALVLVLAAAAPLVHGPRGRRLSGIETEARDALEAARKAGAARWAREALYGAESAYQRARTEQRRQEVRLLPFRDFRRARDEFVHARTRALAAAGEAASAMTSVQEAVESRLARADELIRELEAVSGRTRIGAPERRLLEAARRHAAEARVFEAAAEYDRALPPADLAAAESRRALARVGAMRARFTDSGNLALWQGWIDETLAWSRRHGRPALIVYKDANRLDLVQSGRTVRSFEADLGQNNLLDKARAGDAATPEGRYQITRRRGVGETQYYKALMLDYPNARDLERFEEARRGGLVPGGVGPGSLIEIHGEGGRGEDWTWGCVALSNRDMDVLFEAITVGTPVTIVGSDGSTGALSGIGPRLGSGER